MVLPSWACEVVRKAVNKDKYAWYIEVTTGTDGPAVVYDNVEVVLISNAVAIGHGMVIGRIDHMLTDLAKRYITVSRTWLRDHCPQLEFD